MSLGFGEMWNYPSKRMVRILQTLRAEWGDELFWLCDVGAGGGLAEQWAPFYSFLRTLRFEPNSAEFAKISSESKDRLVNSAAAGHEGEGTFYLTKAWTNSSMLRPNTDLINGLEWGDDHAIVREEKVPCLTVDKGARDAGIMLDYLKVDTQGTELEILKCSEEQLRHVVCLEVEVEFCELYRGQALFAEVDPFIRQHGLYLHEVGNILTVKPRGKSGFGGIKGRIVSADALYFRTVDENFSQRQLQALFLAYLIYGYSEEALVLLEKGGLPITPEKLPELVAQLRDLRSTPLWLQRMPGWKTICRVGKKLSQLNTVRSSHWDRPLGNNL